MILRGVFVMCLIQGMVLWTNCSQNVAGTGTETSAGEKVAKIHGSIATTSGEPAAGAQITLVPALYNPVTDLVLANVHSISADAYGNFAFDSIDTGVYSIQGYSVLNGSRVLMTGIEVSQHDSVYIQTRLTIPGSISIILPSLVGVSSADVFVEGTTFCKSFDSSSLASHTLIVDSLPAGELPALIISTPHATSRLASHTSILSNATTMVTIGKTYRVSTTGSDSNDGILAPFLTIAKGCATVCTGDSLIVEAGQYNTNWPLSKSVATSGLPGKPIVIQAQGLVTLKGSRNPDSSWAIWDGINIDRVSYVVLNGFTFTECLHGITVDTSSCITIRNCSFVNNGYSGFSMVGSNNVIVDSCRFTDTGSVADLQDIGLFIDQSHTIFVANSAFYGHHVLGALLVENACANITVFQSVFEGNSNEGVLVGRYNTSQNSTIIIDSCIFRPATNLPSITGVRFNGVTNPVCKNSYFEGPVLFNNNDTSGSLEVWEYVRGTATIVNNCFAWVSQNPAIFVRSWNADSAVFYNNTLYACTTVVRIENQPRNFFVNTILSSCGTDSLDTQNFRANPLFVGPLARPPLSSQPFSGDVASYYKDLVAPFKLSVSSLAIDAGVDVGLPYAGNAPDMGAFEFGR